MIKKIAIPLLLFALAIILLTFSGCDNSTEEDSDSIYKPVNNDDIAEFVVEDIGRVIDRNVLDDLGQGDFYDEYVYGISGSAIVTGYYYYTSGISCGTDCVRSETSAYMIIEFIKFKSKPADNTEGTVTGTVYYENDRWSRQSGYSYTSGGSVDIYGADISYRVIDDDGSWGYSDTVTFSATGNYADSLYGWCQSSSGDFYF